MAEWEMLHPQMTMDMLGFLPEFLSEHDPDSASKQIDKNYSHGGGWNAMPKFRRLPNGYDLQYPGDPPLRALAQTKVRDELVVFYDHEIVAIFQPDGSFEASRVD